MIRIMPEKYYPVTKKEGFKNYNYNKGLLQYSVRSQAYKPPTDRVASFCSSASTILSKREKNI